MGFWMNRVLKWDSTPTETWHQQIVLDAGNEVEPLNIAESQTAGMTHTAGLGATHTPTRH